MREILQLKFLAILLCLTSCNGGASCPFERPNCCDNALFGCGPFDIPEGCSCGDYFSKSFYGGTLPVTPSIRMSSESTMEGTWRVGLTKKTSGCSYLQKSTNQTIIIRERNKKVSMKVLGMTILRGDRVNRAAKMRGQYRLIAPRCTANLTSDLILTTPSQGILTGEIKVQCVDKRLSCEASYTGVAKRM